MWWVRRDSLGHCLKPVKQGHRLSELDSFLIRVVEEPHRPLPVPGGQGMMNSVIRETMVLIPLARPLVQPRHFSSPALHFQLVSQQFGKEMMIAVPLP